MSTNALSFKNQTHQRGAVLLVAMVIMLIMAGLGVATLSSSTLQERMAGNSRQAALAQSAAEAALGAGERFLRENVTNLNDLTMFDGDMDGLYATATNLVFKLDPSVAGVGAGFDLTNADHWVANNSLAAAGLTGGLVDRDPRFIIEYLGEDTPGQRGAGEFNKVGSATRSNSRAQVFQITAIGWGQDPNIFSVLQATYRTGY